MRENLTGQKNGKGIEKSLGGLWTERKGPTRLQTSQSGTNNTVLAGTRGAPSISTKNYIDCTCHILVVWTLAGCSFRFGAFKGMFVHFRGVSHRILLRL